MKLSDRVERLGRWHKHCALRKEPAGTEHDNLVSELVACVRDLEGKLELASIANGVLRIRIDEIEEERNSLRNGYLQMHADCSQMLTERDDARRKLKEAAMNLDEPGTGHIKDCGCGKCVAHVKRSRLALRNLEGKLAEAHRLLATAQEQTAAALEREQRLLDERKVTQ